MHSQVPQVLAMDLMPILATLWPQISLVRYQKHRHRPQFHSQMLQVLDMDMKPHTNHVLAHIQT